MIGIYRIVDSRTAARLALEGHDPATVTARHSPDTSLLGEIPRLRLDWHALGRTLSDSKRLSARRCEFKMDVGTLLGDVRPVVWVHVLVAPQGLQSPILVHPKRRRRRAVVGASAIRAAIRAASQPQTRWRESPLRVARWSDWAARGLGAFQSANFGVAVISGQSDLKLL